MREHEGDPGQVQTKDKAAIWLNKQKHSGSNASQFGNSSSHVANEYQPKSGD